MESRQTASKNIAAAPVDAKVVTIRNRPAIRPNDGKKFFGPIKSAVACVDLNERSVLREVLSLDGLKKDQQCSALGDKLIAPDPHDPDATTRELDEMWSFVLRKRAKAEFRHTTGMRAKRFT